VSRRAPSAFKADAKGVTLRVRLTPRGGRDAIEGIETLADGSVVLKARVSAAPEKGLANAALEKLLAKALGVPKSSVEVVAGETARLKTVRVAGDWARLEAACERLRGTTPRTAP
jgi:uncharacterized protein YggU (UPF0235/DUF167 family)